MSRSAAYLGAALLFALGVAGSTALYLNQRERPYAALEPTGAPRADATLRGGRPMHAVEVRDALRGALPGLGVAAERVAREGGSYDASFVASRRALTAAPLKRALGTSAAHAMARLVDTYGRHVGGEATDDDLRASIAALNRAFVARGLGYRVAPIDLASTVMGLATFEVREVRLVGRGPERVTMLHAERLDTMHTVYASYGVIERDEPFIIVPVDRADRDLTTRLLPLLDEPPAPTLMPADVPMSLYPWLAATHDAAHAAMMRALVQGRCGRPLLQTEELLATRARLVRAWAAALYARGVHLALPDRYQLDLGPYRRAPDEGGRLAALEANYDALGARAKSEPFACARQRVLAAIEPGLLRRRDDVQSNTPLPVPSSVMDLADTRLRPADAAQSMQHTVRSVRAALASLTQSPTTVDITLTLLLRCWTYGGSCLRYDEDAARVVFAEVARELGIPRVGNLRAIGSERIAELYRDFVARGPLVVGEAARATDLRLFGPR